MELVAIALLVIFVIWRVRVQIFGLDVETKTPPLLEWMKSVFSVLRAIADSPMAFIERSVPVLGGLAAVVSLFAPGAKGHHIGTFMILAGFAAICEVVRGIIAVRATGRWSGSMLDEIMRKGPEEVR